MTLNNIKIGVKLISSYLIIALLCAVVGIVGIRNINSISDADTMLFEQATLPVSYMGQITTDFNRIRVNNVEAARITDLDQVEKLRENVDAYNTNINKNIELYKGTYIDEADRLLFEKFIAQYNQYIEKTRNLYNLIGASKFEEAIASVNGEMREIGFAVNQMGAEITKLNIDAAHKIADSNNVLANRSSSIMIIVIVIATLTAILIGFVLSKNITTGINKGVTFAQEISEGNLRLNAEKEYLARKDEIGMLAKAMQQMVEKLREVVSVVVTGADNIASASLQMSSSSQEMSQGATEQASSAEEVSSSMEEMAANIQQNTDNSQQAEKIALTGAEGIKKGNKAASVAIESMKQIAEKVSIIGDIAFQTNILALNAAVEAARAGEHGRGFAVVAAEVRKLAERSKVAADEIDRLTKNGVKEAEDAGVLLGSIVPEIEKTARLVQEISAASLEQTSGADQVNTALQQLNQVTQQNAAASEELATSAEELSSQAEQLKDVMSFFSLEINANARNAYAQQVKKQHVVTKTEHKQPKVAPSNGHSQAKGKKLVFESNHVADDNGYDRF